MIKRIFIFFVLISFIFVLTGCSKKTEENNEEKNMALKNKKIAMIIPFINYRDEEFDIPNKIFQKNDIEVVVFSSQPGEATGKMGGKTKINFLLPELEVSNFDAIVFVGGPGAVIFQDDDDAHRVAQDAVKENKILAAICVAPTILAKAGVLQDKRATAWTSYVDTEDKDILQKGGASFVDEEVVRDGNIITANGPVAAESFANAIIEALK